jgi:cell division septation protein DedD
MHENSDDGFHEIQLSGKQLVFLFMATTVVSVVIFLCGVLVGRGVRADRAAEAAEAPIAGAPAPTDTVADAGPPAAEPPVPPAEAEPALSYKSRLESDRPAAETLKPAPEPARPRAEETPRAQAPPPPPPQPKTERPAPAASRDTWVVQIVALRDRTMASSIVQRLNGKGYPAFVVNPTAGTPAPVFKVQVGRYADRGEAEQVARRLEKEEQFKPWVSR